MTNLTINLNCDNQDQPLGSSGVNWVEVSLANDFLVFTNGSDTVIDGAAIPSSFQLSQAGVVLNGSEQIIPHYLLADISDNLLKEVTLMSNGDNQYVVAFDFDGTTTSEPVLEAWDNANMDTVASACLGSGSPSSSWLRGITTTTASPGALWSGFRLAGSSDSHFLWLNDEAGALAVPTTLYCNLYMVVPTSQVAGGAETPILVCKYTTV